MNKNLITLILITLTLLVSSSYPAKKAQPDTDISEIEFKFTEYDFGEIKRGSNGTCEFEFKNTGKKPLVLTDVRSSCGCTVPVWPKDPVRKNHKSKIIVTYDTKRIGSFVKTITVLSNASNSIIRLKIKGTVVI
ncbi:MAG: DUF1573 domain-containing protein [Bacteroidales bacterium]|nr:DUF1573 domain-containing protein [Bacteroidales bacterium]